MISSQALHTLFVHALARPGQELHLVSIAQSYGGCDGVHYILVRPSYVVSEPSWSPDNSLGPAHQCWCRLLPGQLSGHVAAGQISNA